MDLTFLRVAERDATILDITLYPITGFSFNTSYRCFPSIAMTLTGSTALADSA
jgi:hypothetical protein